MYGKILVSLDGSKFSVKRRIVESRCQLTPVGIGRWVLGSVAEKLIQHSQDPVLLIRAT